VSGSVILIFTQGKRYRLPLTGVNTIVPTVEDRVEAILSEREHVPLQMNAVVC